MCAAADLAEARQIAPRLMRVVPGIRPEGAPATTRPGPATPREAIDLGADLLVIGRAVTEADDPVAAAAGVWWPHWPDTRAAMVPHRGRVDDGFGRPR